MLDIFKIRMIDGRDEVVLAVIAVMIPMVALYAMTGI